MNNNQIIRGAAANLLRVCNLLHPTSGEYSVGGQTLICRGWALIERLAEALGVILNPVPGSHPLLQGSLATFRPYSSISSLGGVLTYNCDLPLVERVFAAAHEIGHLILHKARASCHWMDLENITSDNPPIEGQVEIYNPRNIQERQANLFALELLMPHSQVRAEYLSGTEHLNDLNEKHTDVVEQLAQLFEVSRQRVLMQLVNVFLTPAPLLQQNPDAYEKKDLLGAETAAAAILRTKKKHDDPQQQDAVRGSTPALVMAGPGSGKTFTLVEHICYLVREQGAEPARLLILTFSNKAANELRIRLAEAGLPVETMQISTFHAYGLDFLRRYSELCGLSRRFQLIDTAGSLLFLEQILTILPVGYYISEGNPTQHFKVLLDDISLAKDYLHTFDDYASKVVEMRHLSEDDTQVRFTADDVQRADERATIYRIFEEQKQKQGLVDFGDLIMLPVKLLQSDEDVLREERRRYDHIVVDEFQDINYASGALLSLLSAPKYGGNGNIWAVSDVYQSIYRFRGASPRHAGPDVFMDEYSYAEKSATVHELSYNYRSLAPLVDLATYLRRYMSAPTTQTLHAVRTHTMTGLKQKDKSETGLYYTEFETTWEELAAVIEDIKKGREEGYSFSDHALLFQRNDQADHAAKVLSEAGIPVTRVGYFFNRLEVQEITAVIAVLSGKRALERTALYRLGHNRVPVSRMLLAAKDLDITPIQALTDTHVLESLDPHEQLEASRLAAALDDLAACLGIWRLGVEYIFGWSPLITGLDADAESGSHAARQSLLALGQLLHIARTFDSSEEASLMYSTERLLGAAVAPTNALQLPQFVQARRHRASFMRYLDALLRSDTRVDLDVESAVRDQDSALVSANVPSNISADTVVGAVRIMTVHASKGLEFPCVYLCGFHKIQPPNSIVRPPPPDFYYSDDENETEDQQCLFYVGVTRAKDKLSISWAKHRDTPGDLSRPRERQHARVLEPLLEYIRSNPDKWLKLPPALMDKIGQANDDPPAKGQLEALYTEFDFWELMTHTQCARKHYYKYDRNCTDSRENSKSKFYKGVAETHKYMAQLVAQGREVPELEALLEEYNSKWYASYRVPLKAQSGGRGTARVSPSGNRVPLSPDTDEAGILMDYYWSMGVNVVKQVHQYYAQKASPFLIEDEQPKCVSVTFDQEMVVRLKSCAVRFHIDRIDTLSNGDKRLVHYHIGNMREDKLDKDTDTYRLLTLYALSQENEGNPGEIVVEAMGLHGVRRIVATKAYTKAKEYRKWERGETTRRNLLCQLEESAQNIAAGHSEPEPGQHCLWCVFYALLCPMCLP